MKILVSGATGFIGSHACVELLKSNYDIVAFDNLVNSDIKVIEGIEEITGKKLNFEQGDMLDYDFICSLFEKYDISAVIHFAALKAVGESVENPLLYYSNNVTGLLNICNAMKKYGCKNMVFSSSATVYGNGESTAFREDAPVSATNPYGYCKIIAERILSDFAASDKDLSIMLLRYFNPIGADESGIIGEEPNGIPSNILPYICKVAVGELPYLNVYGDDYATPDGTGIRDYIHITDIARGHILALEYNFNHKGVEIINLGTGRGTSVFELIHAFEKACGKAIPVKIAPRRAGDVGICCADTIKAQRLLGWKAQYGIDKMCEDSWKYTQKHNKNKGQ